MHRFRRGVLLESDNENKYLNVNFCNGLIKWQYITAERKILSSKKFRGGTRCYEKQVCETVSHDGAGIVRRLRLCETRGTGG